MRGLNKDDLIFARTSGGRLTTDDIARYMKAACKNADVPYGDKLLNGKGERVGVVFHCFFSQFLHVARPMAPAYRPARLQEVPPPVRLRPLAHERAAAGGLSV